MLANHAEAPPNNGLLYILGGGWDTITVGAPIEGPAASAGVFTVLQGACVIRLNFHQTETGREHTFAVVFIDEDGQEFGRAEGAMRVERQPGLPPGWMQNVNIALPLTGVPIPRPGLYRISILVNDQQVGERPFRVLKGY